MIFHVLFISATILSGAIFTVIVRSWAIKNNIVNKPNPIIPQHVKPIPYLGGVGILSGILLSIFVTYLFYEEFYKELSAPTKPILAIISGGILFLAWGIYDDVKQLQPFPKFTGQFFISILSVSLGLQTNMFHLPFIDYAFSVFWILFIVNALNFTDVCDGLAGSIAAITFFIIGILSPESRLFCFLIAGATTGFLFFNLPKASIFLGDAGSHFLGFLLAAVGIMGTNDLPFSDAVIWILLLSTAPVFEFLFITVIRIKKGKPWWKGSPDHFSLRMQKAGFTRWQVVAIAVSISSIFVTIACYVPIMDEWLKYLVFAIAILVYGFIWKTLLKWEVE
jgi:UDP-GlcNAc:undecaprenyl-phosphate GlcNAc-1-phosphate transferase